MEADPAPTPRRRLMLGGAERQGSSAGGFDESREL